MKNFFAIITLVAMIGFAGCVDLDEIWSEFDFLKKENKEQVAKLSDHKSLESMTKTANAEIVTIKSMVDAMSQLVSIVS
ncbi:MAG: hypothetical protein GX993_01575 [Bacteroidales bacterium]|nr:hypothetical protein [Bacteroidales bacterium]